MRFLKLLGNLLGILPSEEEKEIFKHLKKKSEELKMYGGKMVISDRLSLSHSFKTKEGESAYWRAVMNRAFCNCEGCKISKDPNQGFQPCHKQLNK